MKVVITGATGYIGGYLASDGLAPLRTAGWEVTALGCTQGANRLDLSDASAVASLIASASPDVVVNCAALSSPAHCEKIGLQETCSVNCPTHLADALASLPGSPLLIHFSTDQVYSGEGAPYLDVPPSALQPINTYGASKAAFERSLADHQGCRSVVLRSSNVFGGLVHGKGKFLQWLSGAVSASGGGGGEPVTLFDDEFRSFVYLGDVGVVVRRLCEMHAEGCPALLAERAHVFNMGGPQRLSRLDFGKALVKHIGGSPDSIIGVPKPPNSSSAYPSPADISMDSGKLFSFVSATPTPFAAALHDILPQPEE